MDNDAAGPRYGCRLLARRYAPTPNATIREMQQTIFNLVEENKRVYSELTEARREIVGLSAQLAQLTAENGELKQMIENLTELS